MIYETKTGYNTIKDGWVIINHVEHYVKDFHVACNSSLNCKAWDITETHSVCPICAKITNRKGKIVQLSLF